MYTFCFFMHTTKAPATDTPLIRIKLKFKRGLTFYPSSLLHWFELIVNYELNPEKTRHRHQHTRVITIAALWAVFAKAATLQLLHIINMLVYDVITTFSEARISFTYQPAVWKAYCENKPFSIRLTLLCIDSSPPLMRLCHIVCIHCLLQSHSASIR